MGELLRKQSSLLKKKADVPANLQKVETPLSKEYDMVQRVYAWYIANKVDTLPWRDFQKQFPFTQNSPLFTQLRHNQPQITEEDLRVWLQDNQSGSKYKIDYSTYNDAENSFRDVEQLVLQINRSADATDILSQDPLLKQWVDYVGQSSGMSGHPAGIETVGWLRVDFVDQDWLLVDEVQSDLTNSVTQGKAILAAETYEEFVENLTNDKVRRLVQEKVTPAQFAAGRRNFIQLGYTYEKLDEIRNKLIALFQNWAQYGISTLLEIARKHGIKNVAIHTAETISQRDQSVESDKIKMYYDNLAKSFGFKKQQLNVGELQGNFWVRTAAKKAELKAASPEDWVSEVDYFWFEPGFNPKAKEFILANRYRKETDDDDVAFGVSETLCCQDESGHWQEKLQDAGFNARAVWGTFYNGREDEGHNWIEVDGKIFDPTAAQFELYEDAAMRQKPDRSLYKEMSVEEKKLSKLDPNKMLKDDPKLYAEVRSDPRQVSLYGPGHEEELQDMYAKPKQSFTSALLFDFGIKEAGLYSIEDLDDYDSPLVYDLMAMHDSIHLNPIRGVIPDYGSELQGQQIFQWTYNAVKVELLPAVQEGRAKCSPAGQKKVKGLIDEAVGALSLAHEAAVRRDYREAGQRAEFAMSKLHTAIEVIRTETRKKRKGQPVPMSEPKSLGDYT